MKSFIGGKTLYAAKRQHLIKIFFSWFLNEKMQTGDKINGIIIVAAL